MKTKQNRNSKWKNGSKTLRSGISKWNMFHLKYICQYSSKWFLTLAKSWKNFWTCISHFKKPTMKVCSSSFCKSYRKKSQVLGDSIWIYDRLNKYFRSRLHLHEGYGRLKQFCGAYWCSLCVSFIANWNWSYYNISSEFPKHYV